jgi:ribosomal protein S14
MNLSHSPIDDGRQQTVIKELGVSRNGFRNRVDPARKD